MKNNALYCVGLFVPNGRSTNLIRFNFYAGNSEALFAEDEQKVTDYVTFTRLGLKQAHH